MYLPIFNQSIDWLPVGSYLGRYWIKYHKPISKMLGVNILIISTYLVGIKYLRT